jgi:hypothetical protein
MTILRHDEDNTVPDFNARRLLRKITSVHCPLPAPNATRQSGSEPQSALLIQRLTGMVTNRAARDHGARRNGCKVNASQGGTCSARSGNPHITRAEL